MQYVITWPKEIITSSGVIVRDPYPDQCREAGYELLENKPLPTEEEIAAEQARRDAYIAEQEAEKLIQEEVEKAQIVLLAKIEGMRVIYRNTTNQFCTIAGITVVNKLDTLDIQMAVLSAGTGETALPLTQLAFSLFVQIIDLRRLDGDDAWERI